MEQQQESYKSVFAVDDNNIDNDYEKLLEILNRSMTIRRIRPPRPLNSFIIYLAIERTKPEYDKYVREIDKSKVIGKKWKEESDKVKNHYAVLAEKARKIHAESYPNYNYKKGIKKRKKQ